MRPPIRRTTTAITPATRPNARTGVASFRPVRISSRGVGSVMSKPVPGGLGSNRGPDAPLVHRRRGRGAADRLRPVRAPRRLRARPADHRPAGVSRPAADQAAGRLAPSGDDRPHRPGAGLQGEACRPPVPGVDGEAGAGPRSRDRRGLRRRRVSRLARRDGLRRPEEAPRRASRLRRDEGENRCRRPRASVRRRAREAARGAQGARRGRFARGAPRVPGREARAEGGDARRQGQGIELRTLTDGGQPAEETARALAAFLSGARTSLEIAIYDVRLPDPLAQIVRGALVDAAERGVNVRLAYNLDDDDRVPVPPPPRTRPELIESLPFPTAAIPGAHDLMHHKYVVRDSGALWTGSTNWTSDSWTREENVILVVESRELAQRFREDFEQLWTKRDVEKSGHVSSAPIEVAGVPVRPWFCPGHGEQLAHRIAKAIGMASRRVRIASPVISSGPILGTLARAAPDGRLDLAGVVDRTQVLDVIRQWRLNGNAPWKEPLLRTALTRAPFSGKESTPYAPGRGHDYMHAKVTVADDRVFLGSFNLSHSGEQNAENVLEIADAGLADTLAAFIDGVRERYPAIAL